MISQLFRIALVAGLTLAAADAFAQKATGGPFPHAATSQEYKIVLKPDEFQNFKPEANSERGPGFRTYWSYIKKIAVDDGLRIKEKRHGMREKISLLRYLDDQKFSLDGKGYILRVVQSETMGRLADRVAVTLKFRSPDITAIKPDTIEVATQSKAKTEYQDDVISLEPGRFVVEHSPAARIKAVPYNPENTSVDAFATLFPTLGKLGLAPATKLVPVGGMVRSVSVSPGAILFLSARGDEIEADVQMTYWQSMGEGGKGILGEVSFTLPLEEADPETIAACRKFFADLQNTLPNLMPGSSKVAVLYARARAVEN